MTIIFPDDTKATKDDIRDAIGQTVTFILEGAVTPCAVCSGADLYDGINEVSLDAWCATCSGNYWIISDVTSEVTAHVRWRTQDQLNMGQTGLTYEGDCSVTIDIDALTDAQLGAIREVRVDNRKVQPYRMIYRGVPNRDRIKIICREWEKE